MSYIRRIPPPEPERDPMRIVLEELRHIHEIMQILSLRLRRLEQPGEASQTQPEARS